MERKVELPDGWASTYPKPGPTGESGEAPPPREPEPLKVVFTGTVVSPPGFSVTTRLGDYLVTTAAPTLEGLLALLEATKSK